MIARRKFSVAWWSISDLQRRLKGEFDGEDKPATYEWRHDVANAKFLCLDDVGATIVTDWFRDEIIAAIDTRYRSARPVMITTNLTAQSLAESIGDRSVDRILENCRPFRFPEMKSFRSKTGDSSPILPLG
jgi:DNA replication protein DnaC